LPKENLCEALEILNYSLYFVYIAKTLSFKSAASSSIIYELFLPEWGEAYESLSFSFSASVTRVSSLLSTSPSVNLLDDLFLAPPYLLLNKK
jgi:hypothetical protein